MRVQSVAVTEVPLSRTMGEVLGLAHTRVSLDDIARDLSNLDHVVKGNDTAATLSSK